MSEGHLTRGLQVTSKIGPRSRAKSLGIACPTPLLDYSVAVLIYLTGAA